MFIPLLISLTISSPCRPAVWRQALADFKRTRPAASAQDFYKLAHQGTMGSEHAVGTGDVARSWLAREIAALTPAPMGIVDPLVEPLPPDGRFVRVHLRPYVARGLSPDSLLAAFIETANSARPDSAQLVCALESLPRSTPERMRLEAQRPKGFGAVHHSDGYERAYAPAYRVIEAKRAQSLISKSHNHR